MGAGPQIHVVRGRLEGATEDAIRAFWAEHSLLSDHDVRERLPQVICLLRDSAGTVLGVNSVYQSATGLIGGRLFWVYRSLLAPGVGDALWERMLCSCFNELAAEFEREAPEALPIGVLAPGRRCRDAGAQARGDLARKRIQLRRLPAG